MLIVDDEPVVREGIWTIIPWEDYGFSVCGEASDGKEALDRIKELEPDLIVVDIKMPEMNGLEMIEELHRQGSGAKTIILTGYSDFEYARQAVRFGVDAFLLKPIEETELIEHIKKVYAEIERERAVQEKLYTSIMFSKEKSIEKLVMGLTTKDMTDRINNTYKLSFPWEGYQIILAEEDVEDMGRPVLRPDIKETVQRYIESNQYGHVFSISKRIGVLCRCNNSSTAYLRTVEIIKKVRDECCCQLIAALGSNVSDYNDIYLSYNTALDLINRKFIYSSEKILTEELKAEVSSLQQDFDLNDVLDKLYNAIEVRDIPLIHRLLVVVNSKLITDNLSQDNIKAYYGSIYMSIASRFQVNFGDNITITPYHKQVMDRICKIKDLMALKEYMTARFLEISEGLMGNTSEFVIDRVLRYIEKNIGSNITLDHISDVFNYSSSYLGKLFKKHTGKNFNNYLDSRRIEVSKQLLHNGEKVYSVAEKVGYCNKDYFYSKFKKLTGLSPTQYRQNIED